MTTTAASGGGEGGCPSPQDPPLLSQDEFFRHLNLQSVHQKRGKYHYRQALKERLRASSLAKSPPSATKKPPLADNRKSPQVSPCKFLSEAQRRKLFGRPKIRQEKVAAPGAAVVAKTNSAKPVSILRPLIQDCHVLGHPGIKREFEEREAAAAAKKAAAAAAVAAMAAAAAAVAQAAATAGKETETTAADGQAASDDSRDASNQDSSSPSSSSSVASSSSVSSSSSSRSTIEIRHSYLPGSYCNQGLMDQQQRRDLPALNQPQLKRASSEEENEAVPPSASRLHFVCLRPQPGEAKIARLRLLEKGRQEATLAMFGHTSKGQGPPKANLSLLLSSKRSPIDSATFTALKQPVKTSEVAPSHHRVLRQKPASLVVPQAKQPSKKPTRFLRICLTGSASKLLCQDKKPIATEKLNGKEQQRGIAAAAGSGKKLLKETQINNVSHNHQTDSNLKVVEQNIFKRQINGSGIASCKMCSKRYKVSSPLKSWKEALEASNKAIFCDKCRPLAEQQHRRKEEAAAAALAAAAKKLRETATDNRYKCDICNKVFSKRSNMIRHMTNNHPLNIHGVELAKFAAKPAAASAVTAGSSSGSGGNSASYRTSRRQASTVQGTSHLCAETTTPTNSPSKRYVKPLISLA